MDNKQHSVWMYILFPATTMLLGWGLRGYIGGGPFGAMIPGAMVALSIALLLKLPAEATSVLTVFGAIGIGLGGEMTYGQTLGFLRDPETVWWGLLGTTLKGAVWGILGGTVFALGLIYKNISKKTIIVSFLLLFTGMLAGFKLINQPMLVYFSDPANPRPESWAALLTGALLLLLFLKIKTVPVDYKVISRMAVAGLLGGGTGFGLGSCWMVLGNQLPADVIFHSWWKAMEFTFGFLLGAALGWAAWRNRKHILRLQTIPPGETTFSNLLLWKELTVTLLLLLLIFGLLPHTLDPVVDKAYQQGRYFMVSSVDLAKMLGNFAFYGFILILAVMKFPSVAWQTGITFTFCHTSIDLIRDIYPEAEANPLLSPRFMLIFIMTLSVAVLTAYFQRKSNTVRKLFLLLVWSCLAVAFLRLGLLEKHADISTLPACSFICGEFFVHIIFSLSAVFISWLSIRVAGRSD